MGALKKDMMDSFIVLLFLSLSLNFDDPRLSLRIAGKDRVSLFVGGAPMSAPF